MKLLKSLLVAAMAALCLGCMSVPTIEDRRMPGHQREYEITDAEIERLGASIYRLDIYERGIPKGHGSCIVVRLHDEEGTENDYTLALTAGHVTDAGDRYLVALDIGQLYIGVLEKRGESDWSIVRFKGLLGRAVPFLLTKGDVDEGSEALAFGFPNSLKTASRGSVIGYHKGFVLSDTKVDFGSSGGALFAAVFGRPVLIGIVVMKNPDGSVALSVPLPTVFLEGGTF